MPDELRYWGAVAPIDETVLWAGQEEKVTFRVLSGAEEVQILGQAALGPPEGMMVPESGQRDYLEWVYRIARALVSVRGELVTEDEDARPMLVASWWDPLIWELRDAYVRAKNALILARIAVATDPSPPVQQDVPNGDDSGLASISPDGR